MSGFSVGTKVDKWITAKIRTDEAYGTPPAWRTGERDGELNSGWSRGGQIIVRQDDPVPLEISALTVHIQMGG